MANKIDNQLTDEQQTQHNHVLDVAKSNLLLVRDQVDSLGNDGRYTKLLAAVDGALNEFGKV